MKFVAVPPNLIEADISDGAFRLAVLLQSYANADRRCWPSIRTLGNRLGVSYDTARRRLYELERADLIRVTPRTKNGRQIPSLISLRWVVDNPKEQRLAPANLHRGTPANLHREELKPIRTIS